MRKRKVIETLEKYNLNKDDYIILSTGALVLRGIKEEAHDIDLAVSEKLLKQLLRDYDCELEVRLDDFDVYILNDELNFSIHYYDVPFDVIDGYKVQTLDSVINLKKSLNRPKDIKDLKLIDNYLKLGNINVLVLAYLGDVVYELYIRNYLINKGINKVNDLQKEAVKYVSAKAQSDFLERMLKDNFLTDEEISIVKRARNHKSHGTKSADIVTYKRSTGLEALIGYLSFIGFNGRIKEIMDYIVGD